MVAEIPRLIPVTHHPIHLLRALLRECAYLPDPAARVAVSDHIWARFRRYQRPIKRPTSTSTRNDPRSPARIRQAIKKARHYLSFLIRANYGDWRPLLKVLQFTYGRILDPRQALMRELLKPHAAVNVRALQKQIRDPLASASNLEKWPPRSPKLEALLASQSKHRLPGTTRPELRRLEPNILPNIWHRPMPKRREKNARFAFHTELLRRVQPPLPDKEWCRLKDLVDGTTRWEGPVKRRSKPTSMDRHHSLLTPSFLGAKLGREPYQLKLQDGPHRLTAQSMRRLWGTIFAECPVMHWDSVEKRWHVKWGYLASANRRLRTPADEFEQRWFDGVDQWGKVALPEVPKEKSTSLDD